MAKTFLNLKAQTRTYLDEATQDDWKDTEVEREVNVGYMKVYSSVVGVFEGYYSTRAQATSVDNTQEYSLPTNIYKIRRVELNYNPDQENSVARRALPVSLDSILRDLGGSALGISVWRNPAYYLRGDIIGFLPIPTQGGASAITIWYIKEVSELSGDSDVINIPFPDRYYDAIALEAAGTLLRKGQQEEIVASRYLAEAEVRRTKMREELEDRISDDSKAVIDTLGSDVDFSNYSTI